MRVEVVPLIGVGPARLGVHRDITRGREPWLTLLLPVGLSTTVFAVGVVAGEPSGHLAMVLLFAILGLVAMRALFGSFGDNLERFGIVHTATLVLFVTVLLHTAKR